MGEPRLELSIYRLNDAKEKVKGAELLLNNGLYKDSISRSYYAMLSATRALLAMEGLDSHKHSGVISLFNHNFVKTGAVSKDLGRLLMNAKDYREKGDYGDFIIASLEEAEEQLNAARKLLIEINEVIVQKYQKD